MNDVTRIMVRHRTRSEYVIRLARDITEPDDFADEFQVLAAAGPEDHVRILLSTYGGQLDTCHMIRKALMECEAHTSCWIGPNCHSAGSAIALACNDWEVDDLSSMMIHTASFGVGGKASDMELEVKHRLRKVRSFVESVYTGFLSPEEIEDVLAGRDVWLDVDTGLVERLNTYAELRAAAQNVEEEVDEEEDNE